MFKKIIISSCLLLGLAATTLAQNSTQSSEPNQGFSVYPSYKQANSSQQFNFTANPGDSIGQSITIENFDQEAKNFKVYARNAQMNQKAEFQVSSADEPGFAENFSTATSTIEVPALSKIQIPFTITVPQESMEGSQTLAIFAEEISTKNPAPNSIPLIKRIGVRTFVEIKNTPIIQSSSSSSNSNPALVLGLFLSGFCVGMFFLMRKKTNFKALLALALAIPFTVFAQPIEIQITQGGFRLSGPNSIEFAAIESSFDTEISVIHFRDLENEQNHLLIEDLNGQQPFSVSIEATDFLNEKQEKISKNNLFIRNNDLGNPSIETVIGSEIGVELNPSTAEFTSLEKAQILFSRQSGEAPGKWKIFPSLQLKVPANTAAGVYNNTITFTII